MSERSPAQDRIRAPTGRVTLARPLIEAWEVSERSPVQDRIRAPTGRVTLARPLIEAAV